MRLATLHDGETLVGLVPLALSRDYYGKAIPHVSCWLHDNAFCGAPLVAHGYEIAFWSVLLDFLRRLLGIPVEVNEETNLLDLVMATADRVFVDSTFKPQVGQTLNYEEQVSDPVMRRYVKMGESFFEGERVRKLVKQGKWAGIRAPLNLMTLPQIRNTFKDRLQGRTYHRRPATRRVGCHQRADGGRPFGGHDRAVYRQDAVESRRFLVLSAPGLLAWASAALEPPFVQALDSGTGASNACSPRRIQFAGSGDWWLIGIVLTPNMMTHGSRNSPAYRCARLTSCENVISSARR